MTDAADRAALAAEVRKRRTFAIIAHPDAGKTTLTEHLLLMGGAIRLAGQVKSRGDNRRARSDWMKIEQDRGISVTSAVMTFEFEGVTCNLLDTPGHEDFSEDTYRTLTAADSAIMVLDAAKGIEAQTLKLFEVCRLRNIPIITFINKIDSESLDPFALMDEIGAKLALDVAPMTWPAGMGGLLRGIFDPERGNFVHLTPVYFGSALRSLGVRELLEAIARFAPAPRPQVAATRTVEPTEDAVAGFVFKVQANMDANHRDRVAFMRLCSGRFTRGMRLRLSSSGKAIGVHNPILFFAQNRELLDEAYPGDIIGIPNHGTIRVGDTLSESEDLVFTGIPNFAPEILRRVRLQDPMKSKQLRRALESFAEEGVTQVFKPRVGANWIVGVVGQLQLDVLAARMETEYGVKVAFEAAPYEAARWVSAADPQELKRFEAQNQGTLADDRDGAPIFLARNNWQLGYTTKEWPNIVFAATRERVAAPA